MNIQFDEEEKVWKELYYIPYKILVINPILENNERESLFFKCQSEIFQWANREGLSGRKVFGFKVVENNNPDSIHFGRSEVWCQIECSKEEFEGWEKMNGR